MNQENKRKRLYYRKSSLFGNNTKTLQELLDEALFTEKSKVSQRMLTVTDARDPDSDFKMFINTRINEWNMLFGSVILHKPDASVQTLVKEDGKEQLDVESLAPHSGKDGKRREFFDSIAYFGVLDDHVIILQTRTIRTKELEGYFEWILRDCGLLKDEQGILLESKFSIDTREKISRENVRNVKAKMPLLSGLKAKINSEDKEVQRLEFSGTGLDIIKDLIGKSRYRNLNIETQDLDNLEVKVEVKYNRSATDGAQQLLNRITGAFQDSLDDDVTIDLKDTGTVKGDEIEIKGYRNIKHLNDKVEPSDLFSHMFDWLMIILENGTIDP